MKFLLYTLNYDPELIGIGKYNTEMSEWLSQNGHQVRIIAANPYYPEWKIRRGYYALKYKKEKKNNIRINRCPIFVIQNISSVLRLVHLLSFTISSFLILLKDVKKWRPDVIMLTEPPLMCAPSTIFFSKIYGIKTWLHIQDFEIDAAFDTKMLSYPLLRKTMTLMEKLITNQFNVVSSISKKMVDQLRAKDITQPRIFTFPNWSDTTEFSPSPPSKELKNTIGIQPNETMVLYSGNMGHKQGVEIIIETAETLFEKQENHIKFVLCGDGAIRQKIERRSLKLPNIQFLPVQSIEKYKQLLNTADLHLVPQRSDINDNVMPSKLSTILSCGGVIIALANPGTEVDKVVRDAGGIVCKPGDVRGLAEAIAKLSLWEKTILKDLKRKARKYALLNLEKDRILNSFNGVLSSI